MHMKHYCRLVNMFHQASLMNAICRWIKHARACLSVFCYIFSKRFQHYLQMALLFHHTTSVDSPLNSLDTSFQTSAHSFLQPLFSPTSALSRVTTSCAWRHKCTLFAMATLCFHSTWTTSLALRREPFCIYLNRACAFAGKYIYIFFLTREVPTDSGALPWPFTSVQHVSCL